jgi:hypothetical protein
MIQMDLDITTVFLESTINLIYGTYLLLSYPLFGDAFRFIVQRYYYLTLQEFGHIPDSLRRIYDASVGK